MSIISGTPWWVFLIFFYLLYVGLAATRTRTVWIPRLFIIPVIFMSLKAQELYSSEGFALFSYLLSALLGYYLGRTKVNREQIEVIKSDMSVKIQGSWSTIIILMSFFFIKFIFGFASAKMPGMPYEYRAAELGVSGIFTWYFLGRAVECWKKYKRA